MDTMLIYVYEVPNSAILAVVGVNSKRTGGWNLRVFLSTPARNNFFGYHYFFSERFFGRYSKI